MYWVYKIFDKNIVLLYVGKTTDLLNRPKAHYSDPWGNEIDKIVITEYKSATDMELYETYYINKLKPKYNIAKVMDTPTVNLPEPNLWLDYEQEYQKRELENKSQNKSINYKNAKENLLKPRNCDIILKKDEKINLFCLKKYSPDKSIRYYLNEMDYMEINPCGKPDTIIEDFLLYFLQYGERQSNYNDKLIIFSRTEDVFQHFGVNFSEESINDILIRLMVSLKLLSINGSNRSFSILQYYSIDNLYISFSIQHLSLLAKYFRLNSIDFETIFKKCNIEYSF
ncbi:GIY-YIG nuclease family protein [Clostridium ljungdahlii]|uniref:GIY-YIG catalytic domain protein n=1 Tax=Clostridium ljungdahlii TaxID=1538 RepID=A0A168MHM3_9CLOT|nr:GIY-YIG nuclease family protein [Clostridium ljungdahlii]OAA84703.1 GIY-YIG catalytic domain protein [Clostridium ljungdahlii]